MPGKGRAMTRKQSERQRLRAVAGACILAKDMARSYDGASKPEEPARPGMKDFENRLEWLDSRLRAKRQEVKLLRGFAHKETQADRRAAILCAAHLERLAAKDLIRDMRECQAQISERLLKHSHRGKRWNQRAWWEEGRRQK